MAQKTGTSMSKIIDTRKMKEHRKMINCNNCFKCVNLSSSGCRFGWEPIDGKCSRYGTNHYNLNKEEAKRAKDLTKENKEKMNKEKLEKEKISLTSIEKLEEILDTKLSYDFISKINKNKYLGNGKFALKCIEVNEEYLIIRITFKDKKIRKFKIKAKV